MKCSALRSGGADNLCLLDGSRRALAEHSPPTDIELGHHCHFRVVRTCRTRSSSIQASASRSARSTATRRSRTSIASRRSAAPSYPGRRASPPHAGDRRTRPGRARLGDRSGRNCKCSSRCPHRPRAPRARDGERGPRGRPHFQPAMPLAVNRRNLPACGQSRLLVEVLELTRSAFSIGILGLAHSPDETWH